MKGYQSDHHEEHVQLNTHAEADVLYLSFQRVLEQMNTAEKV